MKRLFGYILLLVIGLSLGIGGTGYFFYYKDGKKIATAEETTRAQTPKKARKVLFYRHPMNPKVTSPTPAKDEMGMDYIPIYEEEKGLEKAPASAKTTPAKAQKKERKILFYRHPMNPKVSSPTPAKDEMGMDYIPIYEEEKGSEKAPASAKTTSAKAQKKERKILFYRHPMNPKVSSPTPAKDEMGMDYIPIYEEESGAEEEVPGTIRVSPEKIQKIGVKSEPATIRSLKRTIRTVGRVNHDESRVFTITPKVGGWIEKLYVTRTDQEVRQGQKLLELYSPDLVSSQEEYLLAARTLSRVKDSPYQEVKKGAESLLKAAAQRLRYWDITDDQIKNLEEDGKITRTMTVYAPINGLVTEKMVNEGMKIEPGMVLFKIIDHSQVWIYGEVYEYELPFIRKGQQARISPSYASGTVYTAPINHIYTHFGTVQYEPDNKMEEARTAKIRFELPNPGHKLKLGMYVNVELAADIASNAVTVPDSAVIDTGTRQAVIIDKGDGRFEPREIKVGSQADGYYQIISGLKVGEKVVTSANFLIDSESSFKAAMSGMK